MRHAWLIIAHNEFEVLQHLVSLLDSSESDFYIHFDKKVSELPVIKVNKGRLQILSKRIDVCWGTVSQIKTELLLLETALTNGPYAHYHILSGTHLPLKSIEELLAFYEAHSGEEIMRFWKQDEGDADFKLRRYHFPMRYFKSNQHPLRKEIDTFIWKAWLKVQKGCGIRHLTRYVFRKTDNWLSLSEQGCTFLVQHSREILKKYRWSFCGDEYFVATELLAAPIPFQIFDCPNLLYVDFIGDTPRSFKMAEYNLFANTPYYWARKFTSDNVSRLD